MRQCEYCDAYQLRGIMWHLYTCPLYSTKPDYGERLTMIHKLMVGPRELCFSYMPFSEVCVHMEVAGKQMWFSLTEGEFPMVQLYQGDAYNGGLREYSSPITIGEAGVYHEGTNEDYKNGRGFYCYPELNKPR